VDERDHPLERDDLDPDPVRQLERWLDEARAAGIELAEAAALATAKPDGSPSARMVLVKDVGDDGLSFYSGYDSRKGLELAENPRAALLLYWHKLGRQVRAEGPVERLSGEESDAYFGSRPLGSRLSAAVSPQAPQPARTSLDPSAGAATGFVRTSGSSGSTGSTGSTTAFATGVATRAGSSSAWRRRLTPCGRSQPPRASPA